MNLTVRRLTPLLRSFEARRECWRPRLRLEWQDHILGDHNCIDTFLATSQGLEPGVYASLSTFCTTRLTWLRRNPWTQSKGLVHLDFSILVACGDGKLVDWANCRCCFRRSWCLFNIKVDRRLFCHRILLFSGPVYLRRQVLRLHVLHFSLTQDLHFTDSSIIGRKGREFCA